MGILKVLSQSENDIEKNNLHTQENMFSELDKKIKELSKSQ